MRPVVCFGETLFDVFPYGEFLGGAPLNVAYHLNRLGVPVLLVSCVGRDERGDRALRQVAADGLTLSHIRRHPELPTGTARIKIREAGEPVFEISSAVAWDELVADDDAMIVSLASSDACTVVFGTLALRSAANRKTLGLLLSHLPRATAVCDLNLRPGHEDLDHVLPLVSRAQLLKVNLAEAQRLAEVSTGTPEALARRVHARLATPIVCISFGAAGAGLLADDRWWQVPASSVAVVDAVGAGDAFFAALLQGVLAAGGAPAWEELLTRACALGSYVVQRAGAQPEYEGSRFRMPASVVAREGGR